MRKLLLVWVAAMLWFFAGGQNTYQKAIGGLGNDQAFDVRATDVTGGYIIAGTTNSFRSSVQDMFAAKLDADGDTVWIHTFGGDNVDNFEGRSATQMPDGGYVIAGLAQGNGIGYSNRHIVLIRTGSDGETIQWARSYNLNNEWKEITGMATRGNTIAITGYVQNPTNSGTGIDAFVMTVDDSSPSTVVARAFNSSGSVSDYAQDVIIDSNGQIVIAGYSEPNIASSFIIQLDASLNTLRVQSFTLNYSYDNRNYAYALAESGSNYILAGRARYLNDRQSGVLDGFEGTMLMALSKSDLTIAWAYSYGVNGSYSFARSIDVTGSEIVVGGEASVGGSTDMFIMKTDLSGTVTWSRAAGGVKDDNAVGIAATADGGYVAVGTSQSYSTGNNDIYMTKFSAEGGTKCNQRSIQNEMRDISADFNLNSVFTSANITLTPADIASNIAFRKVYMFSYCICAEEPDFESNAPVCSGQEVEFRITTGVDRLRSVQWDFADDAVVPANADTAIHPTGITYPTGGLKEVTLSIDDGACSGSKTKMITIRQSPAIQSISASPSTICANETVDFSSTVVAGAGQLTYMWDFGNGTYAASENPTGVRYTSENTVQAVLVVKNEYGCRDQNATTIQVNPVPEVRFGSSEQQCTGEAIDFVFTAEKLTGKTYTYAWDFDGGTGGSASAENPEGIVYQAKGEKTVRLTVTTDDNCSASWADAISVFQTPAISDIAAVLPSAPNAGCTGYPISFTSTVASSDDSQWQYLWNFGNSAQPASATVANPQGIVYSQHGSAIEVQLQVSDEHCSATATTTVAISTTPVADFETTATQCSGEEIAFYNTGTQSSDGASFRWTFNIDASSDVVPSTGTGENPEGVIYGTAGEKYVQLVTTLGSCTDTAKKAITIHQTPEVSFSHTAPQCVGADVEFTNNGTENSTEVDWQYSWDFGADAVPAVSEAKNPEHVSYTKGGTKTVTFAISSDYCSRVIENNIEIYDLPEVSVIDDATICANRSIEIGDSDADTDNFTYRWQSADKDFTDLRDPNPEVSPDAAITLYILTVKEIATRCTNTDTVVITMLKNVAVDAGDDVEICWGDTIQIGASYVEGQTYRWFVRDSLSDPATSSPYVNPSATTDYILGAQYEECDMVYDTVRVIVHQLPDVKAKTEFYTDSIAIALGESAQLYASGAIQYEWTPAETLDNEGIYNPISTPEETGTIVYWLEGIDMYGCINTDSVIVYTRTPQTWVPTSFSPNGDGVNDVFYVRVRGVETFEFKIFSRSGELVFSTDNPEVGWDGTRNGTDYDLPQGAYVFYYEANFSDGTKETIKDVINLVR